MRTWLSWMGSLGLGLAAPPAGADTGPDTRHTVLLVQPLRMGTGTLGLGVEHAVGERVALSGALHGSLVVDSFRLAPGIDPATSQRVGVDVDPGVHVYLTGRAPEGLWVGPHLEASWERNTTQTFLFDGVTRRPVELRSTTLYYGASARVGYTAILAPGLSAQVGLGLTALRIHAVTRNPTRDGSETVEVTTNRPWSVAPRLMVGVGWAF
ncbi:hypothetical protein [Archangium primigenium]|uniref:hypothetical protein n=1 Tax=[Archangium] primigenium TaxID=2792470 RepID=UPI0019567726|nr:hypothetical protein [Archangium primigenium]MBM7112280.1 hypothetical protein [Archangium primigenium]